MLNETSKTTYGVMLLEQMQWKDYATGLKSVEEAKTKAKKHQQSCWANGYPQERIYCITETVATTKPIETFKMNVTEEKIPVNYEPSVVPPLDDDIPF